MLPFNDFRDGASSAPIESVKREPDEGADIDSLEICAEDLKNAIKSGDVKAIAEALRSAFTILESEPHEEGNI